MFFRVSKTTKLSNGMGISAGSVYGNTMQECAAAVGIPMEAFKPVRAGALAHKATTPQAIYVLEGIPQGVTIHQGTDAPVPFRR